MDHTAIPDHLKRFILLSIPSVPYLEAILLLHGDPAKIWDFKEILRRIYLDDASGEILLAELKAGGVVNVNMQTPPQCQYQPRTTELGQMIDLLAAVYPKKLVEVSQLIHSKVDKKAQRIADAFNLRKGA